MKALIMRMKRALEPVVLQSVAVCCSVLQRVAACCSVLQCVAVCCSVWYHLCKAMIARMKRALKPKFAEITHFNLGVIEAGCASVGCVYARVCALV